MPKITSFDKLRAQLRYELTPYSGRFSALIPNLGQYQNIKGPDGDPALYLLPKLLRLQILYNRAGKFAGLDFFGPFHLASKIVGHNLLSQGFLKGSMDQLRGFTPANVVEHHTAGKEQAARIDFILIGVLWGGAMRRLKQSHIITYV